MKNAVAVFTASLIVVCTMACTGRDGPIDDDSCRPPPLNAEVEIWIKAAVELVGSPNVNEILISTPTLMNPDVHLFDNQNADAHTLAEFFRLNESPTPVADLPESIGAWEVVILYPGEYPHPFGTDWLYYSDYQASGVLRLTRPAFSCDGVHAFFYIERACGVGCSTGWTYDATLNLDTETWELSDKVFQWRYTYENRHDF